MITAIEKIRQLEQYISVSGAAVDPVLEMGLSKLLDRELSRMLEIRENLSGQLAEFEQRYSFGSWDFCTRYEKGEMGDGMDFIEWAATVEMLENVNKRSVLLEKNEYDH